MKGKKITFSYKQVNDRTLHGTQEISVVVDDFEEICRFLLAMGLGGKSHQETRREKWLYGEVEITIDTWPWIPPFVEIEGPNKEVVKQAARDLGFDWSKALYGSVEPVYQMHYDVTEEEINHWESIIFIPTLDWLLARRKQA